MGSSDRTPASIAVGGDAGNATDVPPEGAYLTDGATLLRVEGQFADVKGNPLLELEDCRTLELVLCPARRVAALKLRRVVPAAAVIGV